MSGTKSLNDTDAGVVAAAEADLDRLLAVEPSAEFAAKVRARIAAGVPPRGWPWGRMVLTLATASALIIAFTLRDGLHVGESGGPMMTSPQQDPVPRSAPAVSGPPIAPNTTTVIPVRRSPRAGAPRVAAEPEIIIDPSFAEAIRRLALSAPYVSLDATADSTSASISGEPAALSIADPLDVPELVLKPADQSGGQ
jgi:hypothetical protein